VAKHRLIFLIESRSAEGVEVKVLICRRYLNAGVTCTSLSRVAANEGKSEATPLDPLRLVPQFAPAYAY